MIYGGQGIYYLLEKFLNFLQCFHKKLPTLMKKCFIYSKYI